MTLSRLGLNRKLNKRLPYGPHPFSTTLNTNLSSDSNASTPALLITATSHAEMLLTSYKRALKINDLNTADLDQLAALLNKLSDNPEIQLFILNQIQSSHLQTLVTTGKHQLEKLFQLLQHLKSVECIDLLKNKLGGFSLSNFEANDINNKLYSNEPSESTQKNNIKIFYYFSDADFFIVKKPEELHCVEKINLLPRVTSSIGISASSWASKINLPENLLLLTPEILIEKLSQLFDAVNDDGIFLNEKFIAALKTKTFNNPNSYSNIWKFCVERITDPTKKLFFLAKLGLILSTDATKRIDTLRIGINDGPLLKDYIKLDRVDWLGVLDQLPMGQRNIIYSMYDFVSLFSLEQRKKLIARDDAKSAWKTANTSFAFDKMRECFDNDNTEDDWLIFLDEIDKADFLRNNKYLFEPNKITWTELLPKLTKQTIKYLLHYPRLYQELDEATQDKIVKSDIFLSFADTALLDSKNHSPVVYESFLRILIRLTSAKALLNLLNKLQIENLQYSIGVCDGNSDAFYLPLLNLLEKHKSTLLTTIVIAYLHKIAEHKHPYNSSKSNARYRRFSIIKKELSQSCQHYPAGDKSLIKLHTQLSNEIKNITLKKGRNDPRIEILQPIANRFTQQLEILENTIFKSYCRIRGDVYELINFLLEQEQALLSYYQKKYPLEPEPTANQLAYADKKSLQLVRAMIARTCSLLKYERLESFADEAITRVTTPNSEAQTGNTNQNSSSQQKHLAPSAPPLESIEETGSTTNLEKNDSSASMTPAAATVATAVIEPQLTKKKNSLFERLWNKGQQENQPVIAEAVVVSELATSQNTTQCDNSVMSIGANTNSSSQDQAPIANMGTNPQHFASQHEQLSLPNAPTHYVGDLPLVPTAQPVDQSNSSSVDENDNRQAIHRRTVTGSGLSKENTPPSTHTDFFKPAVEPTKATETKLGFTLNFGLNKH